MSQLTVAPPPRQQRDGEPEAAGLSLPLEIVSPALRQPVPGMLQDMVAGAALVAVQHSIPVGTRVDARFNGCQFSGEIGYCRPVDGAFEIHVMLSDSDGSGMRRWPRFPMDLPARVTAPGRSASIQARVVDVSRDGLGMELADAVAVGQTIAIEIPQGTVFGVVRHCRTSGAGGYRAGVEMSQVYSRALAPEAPAGKNRFLQKLGFAR